MSTNFYTQWRGRASKNQLLQESNGYPDEKLLQAVWQQQRLLRDQLTTLDGKSVRVLHPGFKNHGAGPDFRGAMIQIRGGVILTGDVEVDLRGSGWRSHGHDRNPDFKNVVLHVIWEKEATSTSGHPTLAIRNFLDASLTDLNAWLSTDSHQSLPEELRGKCCAPLKEILQEKLVELLHQAAKIRWQIKSYQFQARARQVGWEQTLWEGLFRALGYKQNVWPMQGLGELRNLWQKQSITPVDLQARLFGVSGLLPSELARTGTKSDDYLRRIWDQWWREREEFSEIIFPRALWRFNGLRPANHPQRRLALASHWLAGGKLVSKLENWFTTSIPDNQLLDSLAKALQVESDEFWCWHWTFRSARLPKPQPLLGIARVTDLAINVILPWFWIRALEGGNQLLQKQAEHRYFAWPPAEDNSVFRLARERLLSGKPAKSLRSAAAQQGLLQIVRDFCNHSNAVCENCQFPELVRAWKLEA
ncbi:DUF2851 family protein [Pedosphaera parvula]|uniref:DUF2851 domain-containing protein n=1 Tax=Pedosphaera parvula (strain Ellin514) TaxID=320771 RepID=B9XF39_PEDPL|nr:DUF2851 family protein [Pedosphaera parvula]EEF61537.1 hypothetical protein Cflav_PD4215 [Pedosphaera parvula Ellin514]